MSESKQIKITLILLMEVIFLSLITYTFNLKQEMINTQYHSIDIVSSEPQDSHDGVLYTGSIYNIFFHSLIIYPELAYNSPRSNLYRKYMITKDEFSKILPELYKNNFVLININSIYKIKTDGSITSKPLYLPEGKKPLIISLDDLSYYREMHGRGFANKLVLDSKGKVATEINTPEGSTTVTRDGDIIPLLDDFIANHPDFSIHNAKGTIALTGYQGILGYHTEATTSANYSEEIQNAKKVITQLKSTGWNFASHSYSHSVSFSKDTINLDELIIDTNLWEKEVKPLVGETRIFVGPNGQIFQPQDPRRDYLISNGFNIFLGVGMTRYFHYFTNYLVMDRADIDGYRLTNTPDLLTRYFDPKLVADTL